MGFPGAQLEFHLPYYAVRPFDGRVRTRTRPHRKRIDLPFLTNGVPAVEDNHQRNAIYESQISLLIMVTNEMTWTAYSFVDTEFDESEQLGEDEYYAFGDFIPDQIALGTQDASQPIWNPREYFITILRIRVCEVLQEWQQVVRTVARMVQSHAHISDVCWLLFQPHSERAYSSLICNSYVTQLTVGPHALTSRRLSIGSTVRLRC
jgi:hypothetical protein